MGPRLAPGPGGYSGCHVTRSNSLPSGSANVVWRTAATPGGSAAGGSLISWSGLAPRAVSRSVSSSWWSVTRTGWMLFLAVPDPRGLWRIIRGPLSGPVTSTAVSPATAPGLTGRPRALPQKSARAAGSAASMVRAAKLRLTVAVMIASFRWGGSRIRLMHQPYASFGGRVNQVVGWAHARRTGLARPPRRPRLAGLQARAPPAHRAPGPAPAPGLRADRGRLRDPGRALRAPHRPYPRPGTGCPRAVGEEPALPPGPAHGRARADRPRAQPRRRPQRHDLPPARRTPRHPGRSAPARAQRPPALHRPVHPRRTRHPRRPQRTSPAPPRRGIPPRGIRSRRARAPARSGLTGPRSSRGA